MTLSRTRYIVFVFCFLSISFYLNAFFCCSKKAVKNETTELCNAMLQSQRKILKGAEPEDLVVTEENHAEIEHMLVDFYNTNNHTILHIKELTSFIPMVDTAEKKLQEFDALYVANFRRQVKEFNAIMRARNGMLIQQLSYRDFTMACTTLAYISSNMLYASHRNTTKAPLPKIDTEAVEHIKSFK